MGRAIDMENALEKISRRVDDLESILNDILDAVDDGDGSKPKIKPKKKTKTVVEAQKEKSNKKNPQGTTD